MQQENQQVFNDARELTEAGQLDEARMHLLQLLEKEPDNQLALIMLGGNYFSVNKLSEAEMVFERLILMEPGKGQYSIALFNTLWKMVRHEEALEEVKRFLSIADKLEEKETIEQYFSIIKQFDD